MDKKTSVFDDCRASTLDEWDFEKNIDIDIFEESKTSKKKANWRCSNCGCEYKKEISEHSEYTCPNCGKKRFYSFNFSYYDKNFVLYLIRMIISSFVFTFIITFLERCLVIKLEIEKTDLIITLLFTIVMLLEISNILIIIGKIRLNKDSEILVQRYILYNLFKTSSNMNNLKFNFYKTIENRLLNLIKNTSNYYSDSQILEIIKNSKSSKIIKNWVPKSNIAEFKSLLNIYKREGYFYKLYSLYETKQLINFENDINVKNLLINLFITLISLFLSIYPVITNFVLFSRRIIMMILPIIFLTIGMLLIYKSSRKSILNKYKFNIIYISSAIAKTYKNDNKN